jgi:hypothetical protein
VVSGCGFWEAPARETTVGRQATGHLTAVHCQANLTVSNSTVSNSTSLASSASWLNPIEIWFGLLTRKALQCASFASKDKVRTAVEVFIAWTNEHPRPFHRRKRDLKRSRLQYDSQLTQLGASSGIRLGSSSSGDFTNARVQRNSGDGRRHCCRCHRAAACDRFAK